MGTEPPPPGIGPRRLERRLAIIVGVFGLLYTLQTADSLIADWPGMAGPVGAAAVACVAASVLAGLAVILPGVPARPVLLGAVAAYGAGLLLWPFALHAPVPNDPTPWFAAAAGAASAYSVVAARRPATAVLCAVGAAVHIVLVLVLLGGTDLADAVVDGLLVVAVATVMTLLVTALRRGVRRGCDAQRQALDGFARTRLDEATEAERVRTDALVHDCVLTTFLAAAAARTPETEDLAARMAANALRVLVHVNRDGTDGPVVPFSRAVVEAEERLAPLKAHFDIRTEGADDVVLPAEVADAMLEAMVHAMTNSVQHAGEAERSVSMAPLGPDGLRIVVADDGVGFDAAVHREATGGGCVLMLDGMRRVDGRADVTAAPGAGCTVVLSWGSVVIHGVVPLPAESRLATA